jgi:hypothetical protein
VSRRSSDWALVLTSLPILFAMLWLQGREANRRNIDNDELEHLNGAYFTTRGETLYGSIYENHPPLTAVLLQPVVRSSDVPRVLIVRGRWVMLALSACMLAALARLAWHAGGWPSAILAATLLAVHPFYFDKFMEVRPDVPAIVLLVIAFLPLLRAASTGRRSMALIAGAVLCGAGLFTPKVIFVAFGATVAAVIVSGRRTPDARMRSALATLAWIVAGAAAVAGLTVAVLAWYGVLGGFITDFIDSGLRMRIDDVAAFRHYYLKHAVYGAAVTWALAALGAIVVSARRDGPAGHAEILCWSLAAGLIGLFVTEVPLRQFFLTFVPPVAVLAACGATKLGRWVGARQPSIITAIAMAALVLFATVPGVRAALRPRESMEAQLRTINTVVALTGPDDRVFDTGTGLYLTRLPAYRYFFLNTDVLRLKSAEEWTRDVLAALENPRVKVAFADDPLPDPIVEFVRDRFALIPGSEPARLRR